MKNCPFCKELIQDDAIKCRFCGEFLLESETSHAKTESPKPSQPQVTTSLNSNVSDNLPRVVFFLFLGGVFAIVVSDLLSGQKPTFPFAAIVVSGLSAFLCAVSITKMPRNRKKYVRILAFTVPFLIVGVLGYSTGYTRYKDNIENEKAAKEVAIKKQEKIELETIYNQEHKEDYYQSALSFNKENKDKDARDMIAKVSSVDDNYKNIKALLSELDEKTKKAENDKKIALVNQNLNDAEKLLNSGSCNDIEIAITKSEYALRVFRSSSKAEDILFKARIKKLSCYEGNGKIQMKIQIQDYKPLKLRVWIKNISDDVRHANPNHFTLVTFDGRSYSVSTETYRLSRFFDAVDLQPGTETSGSIIFDTSEKPKKLVYSELLGSIISRDFPYGTLDIIR